MAIVPNLNGVPISNNTPLVDPRNLSSKDRVVTDDAYSTSSILTLVNGNQVVLNAKQTRNVVQIVNGKEDAATIYISNTPMTVAGQGIPLFGGNGFKFRGKAAQLTYYVWGVASVALNIMEG